MAGDDSTSKESKRIQKFRNDLIKVIPRIPNDKNSLEALRSKHLRDLLRIYMCWRLRNVAVRSRTVTGLSAIEGDPRAEALKENIDAFIRKAEAGMDLGPHLSRKASRHGYIMTWDPELTDASTWDDKDFLLNVMGLHHFHLGRDMESSGSGLMKRTDEVLFAFVTRDTLEILGLFDHSVFDWSVDDSMKPERERLWSIRSELLTGGAQPGAISLDGYGGLGITTAGTPTIITMKANWQAACILDNDPQLDDLEHVKTLFPEHAVPEKLNLEWHYNDMDFGLLNKPSGHFIELMRGPN